MNHREAKNLREYFFENCTNLFSLYRWAFWIVRSRGFTNKFDDSFDSPCLVPYADMMNHENRPSVRVKFRKDSKGNPVMYELEALHNINENEEVFMPYGDRDNTHLLTTYGFALENNTWDTKVLRLGLFNDSVSSSVRTLQLLERKKAIMKEFEISRNQTLFMTQVPNLKLLFYFRIQECSDVNTLNLCCSLGLTIPATLNLEIRVLQRMLNVLENEIRKLESHIQNQQRTKTSHSARRMNLVSSFNKCKLEILYTHRHFCQQSVTILNYIGSDSPEEWKQYMRYARSNRNDNFRYSLLAAD